MSTATMELASEENSLAEFDFDIEDFFSEPEPEPEPAAGPAAARDLADDLAARWDGDGDEVVTGVAVEAGPAAETPSDVVVTESNAATPTETPTISDAMFSDSDAMFSERAGDDWPTEPAKQDHPVDVGFRFESSGPRFEKTIGDGIRELEESISKLCIEENSLKDRLKDLRKDRNTLAEELEGLFHRIEAGEYRFDVLHREVREGDSKPVAPATPTSTASAASPAGEAWGREPIEVLAKHGLKPAKVEALRAAADAGKFGGDVVGLRDWIAKYDLWHRDVKGCGPKGADAITDALTSYVAANPMEEQPLTPEDEARHVAAAEFLGHTKPLIGVFQQLNDESITAGKGMNGDRPATMDEINAAIAEADPIGTCLAATEASEVVAAEIEAAAEPSTPLASNVKPKTKRKSRAKVIPMSGYHEANADALKRVDALLAGKPDPGPTKPVLPASQPQAAEEEEAYLKGCEAGASAVSCSENPFTDRSSPQAREWHRGWEECSAAE